MSRAEQILKIMGTKPGRTWTSAEISVRLSCAPGQANSAMRRMLKTGELLRVEAGAYSLVSRFQRPASEPLPSVSQLSNVQAIERSAFIGALAGFGYAVHASTLVGRLRRTLPDFDFSRLGAVAADLRARGEIARQPDGKYALPIWKGGRQ